MLWFGKPLSTMENLSISSFLRHGHDVHLYTYQDDIGTPPVGTVLMDADDIVPTRTFARLREQGVRAAIFSDYFRYSLLYQRGGWWTDCDIVCVRPFDLTSEIVLGWQDATTINNAVMRLPAGHEAAALLVEHCLHPTRWRAGDGWRRLARKSRDAVQGHRTLETVRWGMTGPLAATAVAKRLKLVDHAMPPEAFFPVHWTDYELLFRPGVVELGPTSYAVHLWNEMRRLGKSLDPEQGSPIQEWMTAYDVTA